MPNIFITKNAQNPHNSLHVSPFQQGILKNAEIIIFLEAAKVESKTFLKSMKALFRIAQSVKLTFNNLSTHSDKVKVNE